MKNKTQEFPHPYVTVDVIIFTVIKDKLSVLLIKRSNAPFKDSFALPGAFVALDENLDDAAKRAIETKGHLKDYQHLEQLYTLGDIQRDPRGRVVSVSYMALIQKDTITEITDPKHTVKWFQVADLPELAFDHAKIIALGIKRLRSKIGYSSIALGLLPTKFRLTELQKIYESILGQTVDKRNFRKKMLSLDLLREVGESSTDEGFRPAKLYTFKDKSPVIFG